MSDPNEETTYEWIKEQHEHVLKRPDMYVGNVDHTEVCGMSIRQVLPAEAIPPEKKQPKMFEIFPFKTITSPALIKIFDEILVNALDNAFRDSIERTIRVAINPVTGQILILNDGKGIADTKIYEKYTIDVIFGQFMSGSNLSEKKSFVGGRNGVGAAVTNAFSQVFAVQSACPASQTLYKQTWSSNMQHVGEPAIKKFSGKNGYVSVSFVPGSSVPSM